MNYNNAIGNAVPVCSDEEVMTKHEFDPIAPTLHEAYHNLIDLNQRFSDISQLLRGEPCDVGPTKEPDNILENVKLLCMAARIASDNLNGLKAVLG